MASALEMQEAEDCIDRLNEKIAALKAENERLKKALSEQIDRDISGIFPGERALAERAGRVKVPIGYALVPVEPTDRMVSAYVAAKPKGAGFNHPRKGDDKKAWFAAHEKKCRERWKAMLSVSALTEPAAQAPVWIAEERLSSLLARIHRDGGHYEAEHGTEKAWADADAIVAGIYADTTHPAHSPAALEPAAPEGRQEAVAYRVHAPEDEYYGTGPDRLQFHPLSQHDLDYGYRQTPLYTRPSEQAVTEAEHE